MKLTRGITPMRRGNTVNWNRMMAAAAVLTLVGCGMQDQDTEQPGQYGQAASGLVGAPLDTQAAGLTNCIDLSGRSGACWESVWSNGVQFRMTFPQTAEEFPGPLSSDRVDNFYVMAPQTDTPQGALPFPHDHTVGNVPASNHGNYVTRLRGFLVFCSAEGIASGGCVPAAGFPLARTVNGQMLTSVEAIESPANSGLLMLVDTRATFAAVITGN